MSSYGHATVRIRGRQNKRQTEWKARGRTHKQRNGQRHSYLIASCHFQTHTRLFFSDPAIFALILDLRKSFGRLILCSILRRLSRGQTHPAQTISLLDTAADKWQTAWKSWWVEPACEGPTTRVYIFLRKRQQRPLASSSDYTAKVFPGKW